MAKYTKAQVVKEFKESYAAELEAYGNDKAAKNYRFWLWVDGLTRQGEITRAQWLNWSNPF